VETQVYPSLSKLKNIVSSGLKFIVFQGRKAKRKSLFFFFGHPGYGSPAHGRHGGRSAPVINQRFFLDNSLKAQGNKSLPGNGLL